MFEYYLGVLHPTNERLFQREITVSKKFDLHTTPSSVWFTKAPVGKGMVPKMLPLLCKAAGCDVLTNHSLRATALSSLCRAGFQDREVSQGVSGHKNLANLASYNRPTEVLKSRMAVSIGHGK